jgi:hypothetical protein
MTSPSDEIVSEQRTKLIAASIIINGLDEEVATGNVAN